MLSFISFVLVAVVVVVVITLKLEKGTKSCRGERI